MHRTCVRPSFLLLIVEEAYLNAGRDVDCSDLWVRKWAEEIGRRYCGLQSPTGAAEAFPSISEGSFPSSNLTVASHEIYNLDYEYVLWSVVDQNELLFEIDERLDAR